jgi:hypothetical protein
MPPGAAPIELRLAMGGHEGVARLWESVWAEGVWRGAVSASVCSLSLWLALFTLAILLRGRR